MTERERIAREFLLYIWHKEPWRLTHIDREGQEDAGPTRSEVEYALARFARYQALSDAEAQEWWEESWADDTDDTAPPEG